MLTCSHKRVTGTGGSITSRAGRKRLCCTVRCRKSLLIVLTGVLLIGPTLGGEPAGRPTSEPYKGDLSIFENPERDQKLQIGRVMDLLAIREGARVADVGAGSGWFTVRSARRVGPRGVVYAIEINPDYLRHIKRRAAKEKLANIRVIRGKADDPRLPPRSVDAVLLLKTYHELSAPVTLLRHLRVAMRAGARLGIIDRNGNGEDHGLNADVVIKEAAVAGFALVEQHDFVKPDEMDYFLIFRARE